MKNKIVCPKCNASNLEVYSGPKKSSNKESEIIEKTGSQCQKCFNLFPIEIIVDQKRKP